MGGGQFVSSSNHCAKQSEHSGLEDE